MTLNDARNLLVDITSMSAEDIGIQLEETMALVRAAERIRRAEMDVMIRHCLLQEYNRMVAEKESQ